MYGEITVKELDQNDIAQTPQGLEYGISVSRTQEPPTSQLTNIFSNLLDGTYYIWWRENGGAWSEQQTIKEIVICNNITQNQQLIQDYFDAHVLPDLQAAQQTASAAVQDLVTHNFQANITGVGSLNAINATEDYSFLDLDKVVSAHVNGVFIPWKDTVPVSGDTTTAIYADSGVVKWKASVAGYDLNDTMVVSLVVVT